MKPIRKIIGYFRTKIRGSLERIKRYTVVAFIVRVAKELGEDNAGDMAAGIAYYTILGIFPLLLGIIAVLGIFLPSEQIQNYIFDFADQYLPSSTQIIQQNIESVIRLRGTLGIFSILGLFWTGSAIFEALGRVINRAWDIKEQRPFFIRKIRILLMSFGTGLLFLISMAASTFSSIIPRVDLPAGNSLTAIAAWLFGLLLLFFIFAFLLKYLPNTKTSWRHVWPGAILTTVLFEIARRIFTFYLSNFASYNKIYGSLAAIIILLVWIYLSAFILIIGAEFTSEYARFKNEPNN